jgi:putative glutamine transport system permease protein
MSLKGWSALFTSDNLRFLLDGLWVTIWVTVLTGAISTVAGIAIGSVRSVTTGLAALPLTLYIEAFRNLPVLVLVFFLRFGLPATGVPVGSYPAAIVGLSLYGSALCAETFRAGVQSVGTGQGRATRAYGLTTFAAFRHVIFPQAWRIAMPAYVGQLIVLLQASTLVSAVGVVELTGAASVIYNRDFNPLETFLLLAVIYLVLDNALSLARRVIERRRSKRIRGDQRKSTATAAVAQMG